MICASGCSPHGGQLLNLRPADTGRPIGELNLGIEVPNLEERIRSVVATLEATEQEVRTKDGRTFPCGFARAES